MKNIIRNILAFIIVLCWYCAAIAAMNPYIAGIAVITGSDSCVSDATILGETTSDTLQGVDTRAVTSKYTASCTGDVKSIAVNVAALLGEVKVAIYTDSGTEPDQLVSNSALTVSSIDQSAEGEITLNYPATKPSVTKDTVYWVVIQSDDTFWNFSGDGTSGGDIIRYAKTYADAMPSDWDAQGYSSFTYTTIFDLRISLKAD